MSKQAVPESRKKRLLSQVGSEASLPEPSGLRTGAWEAPYLYFCHCFWHRKYSTCASRQAIGHPSSGPIPPGTTSPADEASIKVYFERHPPELLIGYEFIDEMNPLILFLLQDSPRASYQRLSLHQSGRSAGAFIGYNSRPLCYTRIMEIVLTRALLLVWIIDIDCGAAERSLPALFAYFAAVINNYMLSGRAMSSMAKYFLRGLACEDIVISFVNRRRAQIPTAM
ncbi:hypothetical protein ACO22_03840 [Paracoccidioides brasiliensis]|uniref:Uncharacterized protein n=1 Tax=Paracoccidioides brasiliensis TaxID=121759 RepID=A0A1D2JEU4_PARBR|nr:hypothetical protein ACO22_03840 [Paracoccidioides brasiliensis]